MYNAPKIVDEELPPFQPRSEPRTLVSIAYICLVCEEPKVYFQPYPHELDNTDFRTWCWKCQKTQPHERVLPPPKEL